MPEHRKLTRWRVSKQVTIRLDGAVSDAVCRLQDINFKGMQIALKLKLTVDSYIKFRLSLSKEFILDVEVWVAWQRQIDGHNTYGFYFTKLKDADKEKIYKFVYQNVPEKNLDEGGEKMEDRRIFQRFGVRLPAKLLDLNSGNEVTAETYDISAKGIGLALNQELAVNTPLEAWIQIPDKGEPLYTRGIAVWSKQESENEYRVGMDLERADLMNFSRILRV
jgi:PilZ domain